MAKSPPQSPPEPAEKEPVEPEEKGANDPPPPPQDDKEPPPAPDKLKLRISEAKKDTDILLTGKPMTAYLRAEEKAKKDLDNPDLTRSETVELISTYYSEGRAGPAGDGDGNMAKENQKEPPKRTGLSDEELENVPTSQLDGIFGDTVKRSQMLELIKATGISPSQANTLIPQLFSLFQQMMVKPAPPADATDRSIDQLIRLSVADAAKASRQSGPDPTIIELRGEIARMKEAQAPKTDPAVLQVIAELKDRLVQKDRKDEISELRVEAEKRDAAAEQRRKDEMAEIKAAFMAQIEDMKSQNAALQAALMDKKAAEDELQRRQMDEAREAKRVATDNESRRQYAEMFTKNQETMLAFFEKHMNQQAQQLLASQPAPGSPIDKIRGWKDDVLKLKGEFEEMQKIFGAKTSSEIELARDSTFDKVADKFAPVLGQLINLATVVGAGGQQQKATPLPPGAMPPTVQPPNMVQQAQAQALPPPGSVPHPVPRAAPKGGLPEPRVPNMDQPLLVQSTNELYVPPPVYAQVLADLQMYAPDITPHLIISDTTQGKEMMIPPGLSERAMKAMILAHQKRNEPSPVEPPPAAPPPPAKPYRSLPTASRKPKPAPSSPPAAQPQAESTPPPADSQTSTGDGQQPQ